MKTFTDTAGRTWTISLNGHTMKMVKDLIEFDLMGVVNGKLLERLINDPVLLCDVVYALVKEQADAQGVTDIEFGRSMAGDSIDLATTALLEELADFFPRRRRALNTAIKKLRRLETMAIEVAMKKLEDPALEEQMLSILTGSGDYSTVMPASPASIPVPEPSASSPGWPKGGSEANGADSAPS